eukprot:scaffold996_cov190-Alexandrium_tamarense.AAC.22
MMRLMIVFAIMARCVWSVSSVGGEAQQVCSVPRPYADPIKNADPKFRQLKLSNKKVKADLTPCPSAIDYMKAIGFVVVVEQDGEEFLRIISEKAVSVSNMEASLNELNNAIELLQPNKTESFSEEKKTPEGIVIRQSSSISTATTATASSSSVAGRMSEKQKARLLMEKKREREAEEAKAARKKTADLIKQDKFVRENDENWTSKQSAACVKSGSGINTFRDKYGEN